MDVDCTNCSAMRRLSTWTAFNDLTMTLKCAIRAILGEREDAIHTDAFDRFVEFNHRRIVLPVRRQDLPVDVQSFRQGIHTPLYGA